MSKYHKPELICLPFDQYQRYRLVAEVLEGLRKPGEKFEVLDVGGHPGLARAFFDQDLVIVSDLISSGNNLEIIGSSTTLPFPDQSFNLVIAVDLLEHILVSERNQALQELTRVSSELVFISAPFDFSLAREAERMVFDFIKEWLGYEHKYLKQHLEIPAPKLFETEAEMIKSGFDTVIFPNGELSRWLLLMLVYYYFEGFPRAIELRKKLSEFYNQHYFFQDLTEPAYRHLIIGSKTRIREMPNALDELLAKRKSESAPDFELLRSTLEIFRTGENRRLLDKIQQLKDELKDKEEQIQHLRNYIEELEDFNKKVKGSIFYKIYQKLLKSKK